jgi:hypothetical protein
MRHAGVDSAARQGVHEIAVIEELFGLGRLQLQHVAGERLDALGPGDVAPFGAHQRHIVLLVLDGARQHARLALEPARLEFHVVDENDETGEKTKRQKT